MLNSKARATQARRALKPCPFCGKRPSIGRGGPGGLVWYIDCDRDDVHDVHVQSSGTRKDAIEAWNKRA